MPAGTTVALVGHTGAGKSTIAKLLARFYDPREGRITIDGVDLRDVTQESLRRQLGVVPQEGFLFAGTVRENIAFGRPDATHEEIVAAAQAVGAHEFVLRLEDGYETDLQERGTRLSLGQRQLVAFARALLADPRILILDEATSSVDIGTERRIERGAADAPRRPDGVHHRPPALDDPRRRPDRRARARPDRRAGDARRAAGPPRPLPVAVRRLGSGGRVTARAATLVEPTFADVLAAKRRLREHLAPTPLRAYPTLGAPVGAELHVKHENFQPTGAFKVRGGINLVSQLSPEERAAGVVTASTGNHGQSIAYAARLYEVAATICVPEGANPAKVAAIRELGAEVVVHGRDFDEAREHCERLAAEQGARYVHSGDEPLLIAGVATHTLEILEEQAAIDTVIVPIGGGSGAAGACIVAAALDGTVEVIGVQSARAPAAYRAWKERALVEDRMETNAEGLATRVAFELPQRILWARLTDFVLVDDEEIAAAQVAMIESTRSLVEAAGAAPLAAARKLGERLRGRRVALVCSGGNATLTQLRALLS